MALLFIRLVIVLASVAVAVLPGFAATSGHTNWGPWQFNFEVKDGAGVSIRDVFYNNELVLYKASMPVIRVKYQVLANGQTCGPYADRIDVSLLQPTTCSPDVCQRSYTLGGHNWLEVGVMAQIGGYQIYQAWYL